MTTLPKNHHQLADMLYHCIDLSEYEEGSTLKSIIEREKQSKLTLGVVEDWLRGLPTACTIPFMDHEIIQILESCGCGHWSVDDYWRWSADRVKAFAEYPEVYK